MEIRKSFEYRKEDAERTRQQSMKLLSWTMNGLKVLVFNIAQFDTNVKNKAINAVQKDISALMKSGKKDETGPLLDKKAALTAEKLLLDELCIAKEKELNSKLMSLGNIVHDSVIESIDEADNEIVSTYWPESRSEQADRTRKESLIKDDGKGVPGLFSHHELLMKIEGYDPVRGSNVAGHRGYFLTGPGVDLNLAIIRYGLDFLENRKFTKIWTPFFMRKDVMAKTAQLEEFDEALYKIVGETGPDGKEGEDSTKYLIATSEQPISAFHAGEWFVEPEKELPKRYFQLT